jgi:hypothetical protein
MRKFRFFADFNKEEQYLNEMARQGWRFVKNFFFYHFKSAEPFDANYRVDFRLFKNKRQYAEYLTLFDDSGWEHIYGGYFLGNHYFLPKESANPTEDIFSDAQSKANRYRRLVLALVLEVLLLVPLLYPIAYNAAYNIFKAVFSMRK